MRKVKATPKGTRMMWKPSVNAICSRAGSNCAGSAAASSMRVLCPPPRAPTRGSADALHSRGVPAGQLLVDRRVAVDPPGCAGREGTVDAGWRAECEDVVRDLHARWHQAARPDERAAADPGAVLHRAAVAYQ